jgi:chemotaxis protein CheX
MPINQTIIKQLNLTEEALVAFLAVDMRQTFSRMATIENVSLMPTVIDPMTFFNESVTALVGLAGAYSGLVSLHMPDALALDFTSRMLGSPVTEINRDVFDAIGELANIIAGSFKYHLAHHGNDIFLSTPSIFTGKEYYYTSTARDESLVILCDVGDEWCMVGLTLKH